MATELFRLAQKAINDLFSDTSVSKHETRDMLETLEEEIADCIDAIDEDIDREEEEEEDDEEYETLNDE